MFHYWIYFLSVFIITTGLFIMLTSDNFIRKILGLGVFQSAVLIFYIALGKKADAIAPIVCNMPNCGFAYSSPLPHVLMLTAIVVGFATMSVALALIYQIHNAYGTSLESKIKELKK